MTRDEALNIVVEAAGNWANEIEQYIIPDSHGETEEWEAAKHREAANIDEAIKVLTP